MKQPHPLGCVKSQAKACGYGDCAKALKTPRCGAWKMKNLIQSWQNYLLTQGDWEVRRYGGYTPPAADITAFFRPKLKGKIGKFFHHIANKAMRGIGIGLIVMVVEVEGRRIPLIREILPAEGDMSQAQLKEKLLTLVSSSELCCVWTPCCYLLEVATPSMCCGCYSPVDNRHSSREQGPGSCCNFSGLYTSDITYITPGTVTEPWHGLGVIT